MEGVFLSRYLLPRRRHRDQDRRRATTPGQSPLLETFHAAYNARPHQGLPIPGFLPAEFAQRLWLS